MKDHDLARKFHESYERQAPGFGYKTRDASAVPWEQVPAANRKLMEAVVTEVCGPLLDRLAEAEAQRGICACDPIVQLRCAVGCKCDCHILLASRDEWKRIARYEGRR